jgi:type III secretory pathway component EscU
MQVILLELLIVLRFVFDLLKEFFKFYFLRLLLSQHNRANTAAPIPATGTGCSIWIIAAVSAGG